MPKNKQKIQLIEQRLTQEQQNFDYEILDAEIGTTVQQYTEVVIKFSLLPSTVNNDVSTSG